MLSVHTAWGGDPREDLARDEALLERAAAEDVPHLHAYAWDRSVLVLGRSQKIEEIDASVAKSAGVQVLKRVSGGTGVLHQGDLALALALPASHPWAGSIRGLYDRFLDGVQAALAELGVSTERGTEAAAGRERSPICFEDHALESLLLDGRKVLGCAQRRRLHGVLVHGTLLFALDAELQARLYRVPVQRITAAMATTGLRLEQRQEVARRVASTLEHTLP